MSESKPKRPEKPWVTHTRDGFQLEWFRRRTCLEVNVYQLNADGSRGALVSELSYPKVSGIGVEEWEPEAVMIAKGDLAKRSPPEAGRQRGK